MIKGVYKQLIVNVTPCGEALKAPSRLGKNEGIYRLSQPRQASLSQPGALALKPLPARRA